MLGLINQNYSEDRQKTPYLTLCFEPSVKIFELQTAWLKLMFVGPSTKFAISRGTALYD